MRRGIALLLSAGLGVSICSCSDAMEPELTQASSAIENASPKANRPVSGANNMGATQELCDGIDNNGNGAIDETCSNYEYSKWIPTKNSDLPEGFLAMEIESKFDAKLEGMKQLHDHLDALENQPFGPSFKSDSKPEFQYRVNQRWRGRAKLFQDYYYEPGNGQTPTSGDWVVRHRTRFYANRGSTLPSAWDPAQFDPSLYDLPEEDLVQVKDSPTRYGEAWFRNEWGNECVFVGTDTKCEFAGTAEELLLAGTRDQWLAHPGIKHLLDLNTVAPYSPNTFLQTFRQRWTLTEPEATDPTYEISLDYVTEAVWVCPKEGNLECAQQQTVRGEIEVELLTLPEFRTLEEVQRLFEIGDFMQSSTDGFLYAIRGPSVTSKGNVVVPDSTP